MTNDPPPLEQDVQSSLTARPPGDGWLARNLAWLAWLGRTDSQSAAMFYELLGDHVLSAEGRWANMGLWGPGTSTLPQANTALFDLVLENASLGQARTALDVGCGFGTNALRMAGRHGELHVTGLNLVERQLEVGRQSARAQGVADRVSFRNGSATAMPFAEGSFDRLVCVEAAFHFNTRQAFLAEAFRVLRPGGRLVVADLLAHAPRWPWERVLLWLARHGVKMPAENVASLDEVAAQAVRTGFRAASVVDLTPKVVGPFRRWFLGQPLSELLRYDPGFMLASAPYLAVGWRYGLLVLERP